MFITRVTCDKSELTAIGRIGCDYLDVVADTPEDLPGAFAFAMTRAGWCTENGLHYCPNHNPALAGLPIVLSRDYIEPLPGVRLRLRDHAIEGGGSRVHAELLLGRDRYDIEAGAPGAVWRAKHVSEDWPT